MKYLEQLLTYKNKSDLNEFLDDNLLNKELYMAYIANKDNCYHWKNSALDTFNEVYLQCTRAFNDPHPEDQIYERYLNDSRDTLGTRYASDMIFSMVNAIFTIMENKPNNIVFFLAELQARFKDDRFFFHQYAKFAEDFITKNGSLSLTFPYQPVDPELLEIFDFPDWEMVTHNYDEYYIRKFVDRYSAIKDKLKLIDLIEKAYNSVKEAPELVELPF